MALLRKLAGPGAILGVAYALDAALPFVRNVAMARMMEPREFALALTLSAIVAIAELATDIGAPQFAMKSDIREARARGTLHSLVVLRSAVVGAVVVAVAGPLARLFDAPGATLAFALAGGSVFIKGFAHLAIKQLGRDFKFGPEAMVIIVSQSLWTIAVLVLSVVWQDHRAMVAGLLIYAATFVLISHLLSPVRYGFAWDRRLAAEAARFGTPLVPNGVALAMTSLGDRIIVGARIGLDALAIYGPLATTAMLPRGTALRYVYGIFLPIMVGDVEKGRSLDPSMRAWVAAISLVGVFFGLGFISLAEPAIRLVFGERYAPSPALSSLMGLLLISRILVAYPVPLAMATGRTWFVTISSAVTAVSLIPATASLALAGADLETGLLLFLGTMAIVETIGAAIIMFRVRRSFPEASASVAWSAVTAFGLVYGIAAACHIVGADMWWHRAPFALAGMVAALFVFGRRLRQYLATGIRE